MEVYLHWTWAMMKGNKHLYIFFQRSNTTNSNYMNNFDAYCKVIEPHIVWATLNPVIVKSKLIEMVVQDTNNQTQE